MEDCNGICVSSSYFTCIAMMIWDNPITYSVFNQVLASNWELKRKTVKIIKNNVGSARNGIILMMVDQSIKQNINNPILKDLFKGQTSVWVSYLCKTVSEDHIQQSHWIIFLLMILQLYPNKDMWSILEE